MAFGPTEAELLAELDRLTKDERGLEGEEWDAFAKKLGGFRGRPSKLADHLLHMITLDFDRPDQYVLMESAKLGIQDFLEAAGYQVPHHRGGVQAADEERIRLRAQKPPKPEEVEAVFQGIRRSGGLDLKKFETVLRPMLYRLPATSTAQTRRALELFCDQGITMDATVAKGFARVLVDLFGFKVPKDGTRPSREQVAGIEAGHVDGGDQTFERLSKATGSTGTTHIAVIDGGFDTKHPAVASNVDRNEQEIAGNNRDDDNNKYTDDVEGYNFLEDKPDVRT